MRHPASLLSLVVELAHHLQAPFTQQIVGAGLDVVLLARPAQRPLPGDTLTVVE